MRCEEGLDSYNELKLDAAGHKYDIIFANLNCGPRQAINTILLYSSLLKGNDGIYVLLLKLPSAIKPSSQTILYGDTPRKGNSYSK